MLSSPPPSRNRLPREAQRLSIQINHVYQAALDEGVEIGDDVFRLLMAVKRWADEQAEPPEVKPPE